MLGILVLSILAADPADNQPLVDAWLKVSLSHAQDYAITSRNESDRSLKMLPQAVFRHSQPVRGDDIGAVYLWLDETQRPAVIGTTFAYTHQEAERAVVHEFHSLADGPLAVEWRGQPSPWQPASPGLKWQPIAGAPAVENTAAGRQRQARLLARQFSAMSTDHQGGRWELRLVPKALHQFETTTPEPRFGQLYVFCQGTDPELILLLETRPNVEGSVWHFAAASFTDYALSLKRDQQEVWTAPARYLGRTSPHWVETMSHERLPDAGK